MNAEQAGRERRAKEIFEHAVELADDSARANYIDGACAGDAQLLERVRSLLANAVDDSFLQAGGANLLTRTAVIPITEKPGDKIGRYKLLQQIGEGGCGIVYMAEQEEPVRRRVALKIIKPGLDTKSVLARFEAERQALALMDHPNIAKIFDGGVTGEPDAESDARESKQPLTAGARFTGQNAGEGTSLHSSARPYFVMELVRGIKITDYCDQAQLSTAERLKLFIQVCLAVQHAHQKGIIHRDIKPSNVLVTVNDGVAVPKIIDFGIAKATDQRLTDKTYFTQFQAFIGTPAYTSPEQAEMSSLDIDTRSDIYSLGVLLYELLTGQTPFPAERLLQSGLDEMRRIIREEEPQRPSTRLTTLPLGEATTLSQKRQLKIPDLASAVRGDLDWIAMKALEKDRTRRYATSLEFAADLQRHLNSEAVLARPPSLAYKLQRTVRRNKGAFVAAAAVLIALLTGLGLTAWQAVRAKKAEQVARRAEQAERRQAEQALADRDRAVLAESNASAKATEATNALQTANERMVKLNVAEGWRRVEEGDYFGALLPFAEAFALEEHKPDRAEIHQRRLASLLQRSPKLVNVWNVGTNVDHAEFSRDGTKLLTISNHSWTQSVARIWDAATGDLRSVPMEHSRQILSIQWSSDGDKVVTTSYDKTARIWDGRTGQPLSAPLRHDSTVVWACFNSTGTRLVTAAWKFMDEDESAASPLDELVLWDAIRGTLIWKTNVPLREAQDYAVFAPGDDRIVTSFEVRRAEDGTLLKTLSHLPAKRNRFGGFVPIQTENANRVAFSPDATRMFIAPSSLDRSDSEATLLDAQKLDHVVVKFDGTDHAKMAKFSPDGRRLAILNQGYVAKVWDPATGNAVSPPIRHSGQLTYLAFSPGGKWLATATWNGFVRLWNPDTGEPVSPLLPHSSGVLRLAFNAAGNRLLVLGFNGIVRTWDLRTLDVPRFSWRGGLMVNRDPGMPLLNLGGLRPRLFSLRSGEPVLPPLISPDFESDEQDFGSRSSVGHRESYAESAFSFDDNLIFGDNYEKNNSWLSMGWNFVTGQAFTNSFSLPTADRTKSITYWSPGRRYVVTAGTSAASYDGHAQYEVREASNGRIVINTVLRDIDFSRDGQRVVGLKEDRTFIVWEVGEGWRTIEFGDTNTVRMGVGKWNPNGQMISDDGQMILAWGEDFYEVWNTRSRKRVMSLNKGQTRLSFDGAWVACTEGRRVKLYSTSDPSTVTASMDNRMQARQLVFSHDSRFLLTHDGFSTSRLWSVPDGELITAYASAGAPTFSPDGRGVVSLAAGADMVQFWRFPSIRLRSKDWLSAAKLLTLDDLESEEMRVGTLAQTGHKKFQSMNAWDAARSSYPELFAVTTDEADAWERRESLKCESAKDWSNAVTHLTRLLDAHPDSVDFLPRRAQACEWWAQELATNSALHATTITNLLERALGDYNRTLAWVERFPAIAEQSRKPFLAPRSRVLRKLGRVHEANADLFRAGAGIVPRPDNADQRFVDLTPWCNWTDPAPLTDGKIRRFETGTEFDVRASVWLASKYDRLPEYPASIMEIPVNQTVGRLHFLHAAHVESEIDGMPVSKFVMHLADGTKHSVEIRIAEDVWNWETEKADAKQSSKSKRAWFAPTNPKWPKGKWTQLFESVWENPFPKIPVVSMDYISAMEDAQPGLYAITVEP